MLKCPNCGRKAEITKQWGCRWCGYPLVSRAFAREKAKRDAEEARRLRREEAKARREETSRVMTQPKQRADHSADEVEGKVKLEAEQIIKQIVQQMEKEAAGKQAATIKTEKTAEKQVATLTPPQVKPFELPSRPSSVPEKILTTAKIKVFIVDRDLLSSHGLVTCLSQNHPIEVIGRSDYFTEDTILMIQELAPNVALVDIDLPSLSGLDLARRIIERSPNISVLVLTPYEDNEQIFAVLKSGASSYLSKHTPAEELASAIQRVYKGDRIIDTLLIRPMVAQQVLTQFHGPAKATEDLTTSLSPQEAEMLSYFANCYSRKHVAYVMVMSDEAIGDTSARIVSKLIANERQYRTSSVS